MNSRLAFHAFGAKHNRAAAGDDEAAERYERLAAHTSEPDLAADYRQRAEESRASAQRNREAINARLQGRKP